MPTTLFSSTVVLVSATPSLETEVNIGAGRYDRLREIAFDDAFVLWQMGLVKETTS